MSHNKINKRNGLTLHLVRFGPNDPFFPYCYKSKLYMNILKQARKRILKNSTLT